MTLKSFHYQIGLCVHITSESGNLTLTRTTSRKIAQCAIKNEHMPGYTLVSAGRGSCAQFSRVPLGSHGIYSRLSIPFHHSLNLKSKNPEHVISRARTAWAPTTDFHPILLQLTLHDCTSEHSQWLWPGSKHTPQDAPPHSGFMATGAQKWMLVCKVWSLLPFVYLVALDSGHNLSQREVNSLPERHHFVSY